CVTANEEIDKAIALASIPNTILTTFGDMMKVPGSYSSLALEKAKGLDVRVCFSTLDALKLAEENPDKNVIFYGVGFETTAPTIALSIIEAKKRGLKNYFVLSVHKTVPLAMKALLSLGEIKLHGFLCPGHVSTIIGSDAYQPVVDEYHIPCVISGFEPIDILMGIYFLVKQIENNEAKVENRYKRAVKPEGNILAQKAMDEVFEPCDTEWRGIGVIPGTGLKIRAKYSNFDASTFLNDIELPPVVEPKGCSCGEVLRGVIFPYQCKLFGKACTPDNPIGPCMVSSEGSCAAYYRYEPLKNNQ
ncbi:MAG: hydrogenase formation protein HypD, partial [Actinomycetia bacterium]|nr:hydrogenase formation protein HypD [Actinomycetes bacterium]